MRCEACRSYANYAVTGNSEADEHLVCGKHITWVLRHTPGPSTRQIRRYGNV